MHTMTADGLKVLEAEEYKIMTEKVGVSHSFSNPFASTFFDFECLLANGTGDPCDAYRAEAYADMMFVNLRVDSLMWLWLSTIFQYSLAQGAGIPRPRFVDGRIDWPGVIFWLSWMLTQLCQFLVVFLSLVMQIASYLGVRERTDPCMIRVDNVTLLDEYAKVTFAAQPALLGRLLLLVVYGYLLSLGVLVFNGRNMNEVDFKAEASKTKTSLVQPIPLARVLYFISRWALYGICLGTVGGWLGWPVALVLAAVGSLTGGFRRGNDWLTRATIAKCALGVLLALPILPNLVYLPLAVLFLLFVKLSFAAGWLLTIIESTATWCCSCLVGMAKWVLTKIATISESTATIIESAATWCCSGLVGIAKWVLTNIATQLKTAISWLAPLGSLELSSGMSMVVQGLAYTETSVSTLAGGLACVLGCLALSPLVAYGTWAAEQGRLESDYSGSEDSVVDAVQARPWILWLLVAMPVVLLVADCFLQGQLLFVRCRDRTYRSSPVPIGTYRPQVRTSARIDVYVILTVYVIPFLLALGFAIFFTSLDDSFIERLLNSIWMHAKVCYADSFAVLAKFHINVSGLWPFFNSVIADIVALEEELVARVSSSWTPFLECLADIKGHVMEVVHEALKMHAALKMQRFLEIDPSYFVEQSAKLDVLNTVLAVLKMLAPFGSNLFALGDVVKGLVSGEKEEGDDDDDGQVEVHECVADPKLAQLEADFELLCQRGRLSDDEALLDLSGPLGPLLDLSGLAAEDVTTIGRWLKTQEDQTLTELNLGGNSIGDEGAKAIGGALAVNGVLKTLNLFRNNIGPEGATAIGEALRGNGVLTDLNLCNNKIRDEGAAAIAEALRGNAVLTKLALDGDELDLPKLRGTDPVESLDLSSKGLGSASAIVIASLIAGNGVLTDLNLLGNKIGPTGATAIAEALSVNGVLADLNLGRNQIGDEGAKAIGGALAVNGVLKVLNLRDNRISDAGAAAIAEALRANGVLKSLALSGNNIRNEGATALADALRVNGVMTRLWLGFNNIGDEGAGAIRDAVSGRVGFELFA